jgi:D-alanine-D-alanine ligase
MLTVSTISQTKSSLSTTKSPQKTTKRPKVKLAVDRSALKKLNLVAVAYSHVERESFPTEEAYLAELEVEQRAQEVIDLLRKLNIQAKGYPGDQYFLTNLLVDKPNLVLNLVDTLRGKDALQTSIPGALELTEIPYTGAGMRGLVIGNDRNLFKSLLIANDIPTPAYQFISRRGTKVDPGLGLPLIVKLNESGGSVGIDNQAVKETLEEAEEQVNELIGTYKLPVIVEQFIPGSEITVVVFEDGERKHTFMGEKKFRKKPDGKYFFTSLESYADPHAYKYRFLKDMELEKKIERLAERAFSVLHNEDYSKFDVRIDEKSGTPYFTDCNPNTAFGPDPGLPFTEVLKLYGIKFESVLTSLVSKHAKKLS